MNTSTENFKENVLSGGEMRALESAQNHALTDASNVIPKTRDGKIIAGVWAGLATMTGCLYIGFVSSLLPNEEVPNAAIFFFLASFWTLAMFLALDFRIEGRKDFIPKHYFDRLPMQRLVFELNNAGGYRKELLKLIESEIKADPSRGFRKLDLELVNQEMLLDRPKSIAEGVYVY